jgi:hypothetical protein
MFFFSFIMTAVPLHPVLLFAQSCAYAAFICVERRMNVWYVTCVVEWPSGRVDRHTE